jgi:thiamine-phosphate pyrophosphorylase
MSRAVPRLHAVTDDQVLLLPDLDRRAAALASAGDLAFHVRGRLPVPRLLDVARRFRSTGRAVLINDRVDLAAASGAAGVHLPAAGLPTPVARRLLGPEALIGRSAHDADEARDAFEDGADYVLLGPIWATPSHPERGPLGADAIAAALPAVVIAIGGITPERARVCREAGAYGVAAVSALWGTADPGRVMGEFLLSLG